MASVISKQYRYLLQVLLITFVCVGINSSALAQGGSIGPVAQANIDDRVRIDQKLNQQIPLDIPFKDEDGKQIKIGDYFADRPVILVMPFFRCQGMCLVEMDGTIKACNGVNQKLGRDYQLLVVSIDPKEGPELAAEKKREYVHDYGMDSANQGIHCLTGDKASIQRLADAVGFGFYYSAKSGAPVHSTALMILTPHGKLSRYLMGADYAPRNLNLALVEAGENKIGNFSEKATLLCSQFDEHSGKYSVAIIRLLQITGCGTALILGSFIFSMIWMERSRNNRLLLLAAQQPKTE